MASWDDPAAVGARYRILTGAEWNARPAAALLRLRDEQGDPVVLVQMEGNAARHDPAVRRKVIVPRAGGIAAAGPWDLDPGSLRRR